MHYNSTDETYSQDGFAFYRVSTIHPINISDMKNTNTTMPNDVRGEIAHFSSPTAVANPVVEKLGQLNKIKEHDKLVRRYSFDDNGGGYLGL